MTKRIPIRSLIRTRPEPVEADGKETVLPPAVAESRILWDGLSTHFARALAELCATRVSASFQLSVVTPASYRAEHPEPGLLIPLGDSVDGALVRLPGNSARTLADFLLRARMDRDAPETDMEIVDGLLLREPLERLATLLGEAFGEQLVIPASLEPQRHWPVHVPSSQKRLLARCLLEIGDGMTVTLELLFSDDRAELLAGVMSRSSGSVAPSSLCFEVNGIIGRWFANAEEVSAIEPGRCLVIPGGDPEAVSIEISVSGIERQIAAAALGTVRGRHALKVTSLASTPKS